MSINGSQDDRKRWAQASYKITGGSTALLVFIMLNRTWVVNCGDSRAVLYRWDILVPTRLHLKGQCHEIFCFWFFHESVSPKPLIIPLGPFRIFLKILGDVPLLSFIPVAYVPPVSLIPVEICHWWQFATGVVDTGVVDTGVVDTGGKLAAGINDNNGTWWKNLPPVSLIPVVHLGLRISPRIFKEIWNCLNGILWGWGDTDSWKKP
jgi:hypothetical protein